MFKFVKKFFSKKNKKNEIISIFGNKQESIVQMGGNYCSDLC